MPPTPYNYAPNRVHDAQHFGPICMQRFPMPLPAAPSDLAGETFGEAAREFGTKPETVRRLASRNQSEDCLNLNVYAPLEGKLLFDNLSACRRRRRQEVVSLAVRDGKQRRLCWAAASQVGGLAKRRAREHRGESSIRRHVSSAGERLVPVVIELLC